MLCLIRISEAAVPADATERVFNCVGVAASAGLPIEPPSEISSEAVSVKELSTPELDAWTHQSNLYFVVRRLPADKVMRIPRLANSVKAIYWKVAADNRMNLRPEPAEWLIDLAPLPADASAILVMELDGPLTLFNESLSDSPDKEGVIRLPASHATTSGTNLRYEPQPHKNTVGYWSIEQDTASWRFQGAAPGEYEVDILQGCGKGHGGSSVKLVVTDVAAATVQEQSFEVQETGHFQNFIWRTLGTIRISSDGKQTVQLIPARKVAGAVMDVREIRIVPKGTTRAFQPQLQDPDSFK
jgi:hypothetical protein